MAYYVKPSTWVQFGNTQVKKVKKQLAMKPSAAKTASALVVGMLVLGCVGANIWFSIRALAFDLGFYEAQWDLHNIPRRSQIAAPDLKLVGMRLINYLKGKEATPQIEVAVDGLIRPLYRQHELIHLGDVQSLFQALSGLMWASLTVSLLAVVLAARLNARRWRSSKGTRRGFTGGLLPLVSKSLKASAVLLVIITLILAVPAAFNFTSWWTGFHLFTFKNELWRLDPHEDWLIKIFPEEFFFAAAKRIALYSAMLTAVYVIFGMRLGQDFK